MGDTSTCTLSRRVSQKGAIMDRVDVSRAKLPTIVALMMLLLVATFASPPPALAAPFTSPDGLWTWSRPQPLGYPAGGIHSDPAPAFVDLSAIAAPAPGALFVATTVSDLLTTADSGSSWGWSPTGAVAGFGQPQAVDFVSPSEGWVSGTDASGWNAMVLHTSDRGATWQSSLTIPSHSMAVVQFADASSGWVLAGDQSEMLGWVASSTTDGGATWSTPVALPQDTAGDIEASLFEAFAPRGGASAVFMETDHVVGGRNDATTVWRTSDGGATWQLTTRVNDYLIDDMTFSSPKVGWAVGAWLWHTVDGGAHWHKVRAAPLFAQVTTVGHDVWVVSSHGSLHSSDGGATWHTLSSLSGSQVSFSDRSDGWVVGAAYLHTTDGGRTWSRVTTPQSGVATLKAVAHDTVWAAAGRVIRSTDAGGRWRSCTRRTVTAVAAISPREAWAAGARGLVIHTTDGGHHWRILATGVTVDLNEIVFVDAQHGWAAGNAGVIRTVDGGHHWIFRHQPARHMSFADAEHGVGLGASSAVWMTENGGRTWSQERLPSTDRPTAALMEDASHALIIARGTPNAQCFTSSDGGRTWQLGADVPSASPAGPYAGNYYVSVALSGAQLCAVSQGGDVATSRDDAATWSNEGVVMGPFMTSVQFVGTDTLMIGGVWGVMTRNLTTAPLP